MKNTGDLSKLAGAFPKEWLAEHPVLSLPSLADVRRLAGQGEAGIARLGEILGRRAEMIRLEREDPLRFGFEPETYKRARALLAEPDCDELLLMGGNREGKSHFAAKWCVERLVNKEGAVAAFFHSSEKSSIDQQQPLVHRFLPPEWRGLNKRERAVYLSYARATGFSNFKFILPNKSMGLFFNYKQDVGVMEGYEFDAVWMDELVPLAFLEALSFRLSRERRMQLLITFTPVRGYTPVIASYVGGAEVVETRRAELLPADRQLVRGCPAGHMPFVMRGRRAGSRVLFFHIGMNPYGAEEGVARKLEGRPEGDVKIRAYGWADKLTGAAFARFSRKTHAIPREKFAEIERRGGTRFCVIDPGGAKNWFVKWYFATPEGWTIVYREWPDLARHGEWALAPAELAHGGTRVDWRPGPAQRAEAGRGIVGYKRLLLELEGAVWREDTGAWDFSRAEKISRRLMDSRMGGSPVPTEEEGTSIIELMFEEHRDARGRVTGPSMDFEPAPGSGLQETIQLLAERFDWNENEPRTAVNCPKWYVLEDCAQSILAYEEYTGAGTDKDALKDIVDPDRYYVKAGCEHVAAGAMRVRGGGFW
jgi:hypothetical protein